jgi:chemotaxis protein methyltransferase CheR
MARHGRSGQNVNRAPTRQDEERFRDTVRAILGLQFEDARLDEVGALLRHRTAATGTDVPGYLRLLGGPAGAAEARAVAEVLTVGETYFFRNEEQFGAMTEVAIPELLRRRSGRPRLRVLSAGCSSGEEPYSVAMLLRDAFPELLASDLRVTAIDVNPARLARARAGRYSPWSLRETPERVRDRWFRPEGSGFVIDDQIRRSVTFEERNLLADDPLFWQEDAFDLVLFRNVGMYFPPEVMQAVTRRIARALAPGGFLFLGHAETLRGISRDFHLRQSHGCFYYQRRGPDEAATGIASATVAALPAPAPTHVSRADLGDLSWVESILRASARIAELDTPEPARFAAWAANPPSAARAPAFAGGGLPAALELMQDDRPRDALARLGDPSAEGTADRDTSLLRAVLLTSCGRIDEAERLCAQLLATDELDAGAHYLAALCREHAGDRDGAIDHDRAAAHVDPSFAMPHLHLGLLARRAGDLSTARHELGQAEILLQREDASRVLLFGGGFHRDGLLQLCRTELRSCGVGA